MAQDGQSSLVGWVLPCCVLLALLLGLFGVGIWMGLGLYKFMPSLGEEYLRPDQRMVAELQLGQQDGDSISAGSGGAASVDGLAAANRSSLTRTRPSVLFLLFTVGDDLPHAELWRSFLSKAPPDLWDAYVHCDDPKGCKRNRITEKLPGLKQVPTVGSERCTNLVSPQWRVVASAVKGNLSGKNDKFVLLSGACLPLKPFRYIYKTLVRSAESDICLQEAKGEWQMMRIQGITSFLVKHGQWAVLTREHAQRFADEWTGLDEKGRWSFEMHGPRLNGVRMFADRKDRHNWRCADEFALFAVLFGLFVPGQHAPSECPLNRTLSCRSPPGLLKQSRCRTIYFFYPSDKSEVLESLKEDQTSHLTWRGDGHPAEYTHLSKGSLLMMRKSKYLFARKFPPLLDYREDYARIMFS